MFVWTFSKEQAMETGRWASKGRRRWTRGRRTRHMGKGEGKVSKWRVSKREARMPRVDCHVARSLSIFIGQILRLTENKLRILWNFVITGYICYYLFYKKSSDTVNSGFHIKIRLIGVFFIWLEVDFKNASLQRDIRYNGVRYNGVTFV